MASRRKHEGGGLVSERRADGSIRWGVVYTTSMAGKRVTLMRWTDKRAAEKWRQEALDAQVNNEEPPPPPPPISPQGRPSAFTPVARPRTIGQMLDCWLEHEGATLSAKGRERSAPTMRIKRNHVAIVKKSLGALSINATPTTIEQKARPIQGAYGQSVLNACGGVLAAAFAWATRNRWLNVPNPMPERWKLRSLKGNVSLRAIPRKPDGPMALAQDEMTRHPNRLYTRRELEQIVGCAAGALTAPLVSMAHAPDSGFIRLWIDHRHTTNSPRTFWHYCYLDEDEQSNDHLQGSAVETRPSSGRRMPRPDHVKPAVLHRVIARMPEKFEVAGTLLEWTGARGAEIWAARVGDLACYVPERIPGVSPLVLDRVAKTEFSERVIGLCPGLTAYLDGKLSERYGENWRTDPDVADRPLVGEEVSRNVFYRAFYQALFEEDPAMLTTKDGKPRVPHVARKALETELTVLAAELRRENLGFAMSAYFGRTPVGGTDQRNRTSLLVYTAVTWPHMLQIEELIQVLLDRSLGGSIDYGVLRQEQADEWMDVRQAKAYLTAIGVSLRRARREFGLRDYPLPRGLGDGRALIGFRRKDVEGVARAIKEAGDNRRLAHDRLASQASATLTPAEAARHLGNGPKAALELAKRNGWVVGHDLISGTTLLDRSKVLDYVRDHPPLPEGARADDFIGAREIAQHMGVTAHCAYGWVLHAPIDRFWGRKGSGPPGWLVRRMDFQRYFREIDAYLAPRIERPWVPADPRLVTPERVLRVAQAVRVTGGLAVQAAVDLEVAADALASALRTGDPDVPSAILPRIIGVTAAVAKRIAKNEDKDAQMALHMCTRLIGDVWRLRRPKKGYERRIFVSPRRVGLVLVRQGEEVSPRSA